MRFSIVTITFNAEKYLAETLTSVANQTFSDFEHILWDGGSVDRTLEIAAQFPHVKVFQGKDRGISDAMNKGAALARGEFLLHLHADDFLINSQALMRINTCLKQHPDVKWLYGQADIVDNAGKRKRKGNFIPFYPTRLRKYNMIAHPATVISRELFALSGGFDPSLKYCMDYDLWLRLSQKTFAYALPATLSCFREHENSVSTKEQLGVADEAYAVRNRYVESLWERWRSYRTWKRRKRVHA